MKMASVQSPHDASNFFASTSLITKHPKTRAKMYSHIRENSKMKGEIVGLLK